MYFIDSVFFIQNLLIYKQKSNQEGAVINVWEQCDLLLESLNRFQGICFLFSQLPNFAFQIDVKCEAFESFMKQFVSVNCLQYLVSQGWVPSKGFKGICDVWLELTLRLTSPLDSFLIRSSQPLEEFADSELSETTGISRGFH